MPPITIRQTKRENDTDGKIYEAVTTPRDEVVMLPIDALHDYPNQPFRPYSDDKLDELVEDIKINGVLSPIIVRKRAEGGWQVLAGHNRKRASIKAGRTEVPCIIRNVDDVEAERIMLTTNLNQRQEMLPSEKAWAYKRLLDNLKQQGKRTDLTSVQIAPKLSTEKIGEQFSVSKDQIKKHIKLTELHTTLLSMVDDGELGLISGYHLAFIPLEQQQMIVNFLADFPQKISTAKAELLKEMAENKPLSLLIVKETLCPTKDKKNENWKKQTKDIVKLIPKTATDTDFAEIMVFIKTKFKR